MKKNASTYLPLIVLVVIFVFLGIFLFRYEQYPIDDDWSYIKAAESFHHTGEMKFTSWTAMSLVFQIWWGTCFTKLFGYSIAVLRLSTLVISLAGLIFIYLLLRELGYGGWNSFLALLLLLFNPFSFPLNFTFFTDHFFISLLFIAIYFYYRAFKENREFLLAIGSLAACAAVLVRQNGILIPAAVLLYLVLSERSLIKIIRRGVFGTFLPVITLAGFTYWFNTIHGPTLEYVRQFDEIVRNVKEPYLLLFKILWRPVFILEFLGFCLLPLSFSLLPGLKELRSGKHHPLLLLFCFSGTLFYLLFEHIGLPTSVDLWHNGFRFAYISEYGYRDAFHIMFFIYRIADFLALASIVYLCCLLMYHRRSVRQQFFLVSPSFLIVLIGIFQLLFLLITIYKFSRYYLVLIPFSVIVILEIARHVRVNRKIFVSLLACYGLFSLAVTQDFQAWNQCKWQAAQHLLTTGVSPQKISAGFAWDAWHSCGYSLEHPYEIVSQKGDIPWWIEKLTPAVDPYYLISNSPVPTGFETFTYFDADHYHIAASNDYFSMLFLKNRKVYLLERSLQDDREITGTPYMHLLHDLKGVSATGIERSEDIQQIAVEMGGSTRAAWLQPSPSSISFRVQMPQGRCRLTFALGMMPSCWNKEGDGVRFKISINDTLLENTFPASGLVRDAQIQQFLRPRTFYLPPRTYFIAFIDPKSNKSARMWCDSILDLSPFAGKVVDIIFEVDGGPLDDNRYDEALWGNPVIEYY